MSLRTNDARNRALRTFLQGLGFTVAAALVVSLLSALTTAASWSEFGGVLVGFAFFQSVATAVLSWVMRAWLDASRVPTPLPPADPGEPDAARPILGKALYGQRRNEAGRADVLYILAVILVAVLILALLAPML